MNYQEQEVIGNFIQEVIEINLKSRMHNLNIVIYSFFQKNIYHV